jgi:DNA helicase-2/ATP-dependent DNA helicase PcrA
LHKAYCLKKIPRKNIFILARTNKQLDTISQILDAHSIKYLMRTVEEKKENLEPNEDEVTLSTVHAIKGLEAELVYMIGVNSQMYPCIVSEHPFLNIVKLDDDYDKYAEELRLLYVGLTRAKKQLVVSYYNSLSKFITKDVKECLNPVKNSTTSNNSSSYKISGSAESVREELRLWRLEKSRELGIKPYMIFSDRTLNELVERKPKEFYELQTINGIGPTKVVKFGEDILRILG